LLRFHDPLTRLNWGGRSTSLALAGLLEQHAGREIVSTIGAPHILAQLSEIDRKGVDRSVFMIVNELAGSIVRGKTQSPKLNELHAHLMKSDDLVVNGEGDFIFTERLTLARTLAIMRAAHLMGKPVYLLNSMLSYAPIRPETENLAIQTVGSVLEACQAIVYRDPTSFALHNQLYPHTSASWSPDALFTWAHQLRGNSTRGAFSAEAEGLPIPVQRLLMSGDRYVVLSGTSQFGVDLAAFRSTVLALADALGGLDIRTIFVGSDTPDRRLVGALEDSGIPCVDPQIPLTTALHLLRHASALVSGRYHATILASLGGTPFVLMSSNSHKTQSLHELIPFTGRYEEQPFFSGGDTQGGELADVLARIIAQPGVRWEILRAVGENSRSTISGVVQALSKP
jgi:hypothetical protein